MLADHGRIDGLVNNAGGQYRAPLKTISTKGFEAVVKSNLTGGFIVMREVYNRWMIEHGGAIVNMIADIWHGWPHFSHSAAARGGMLTLSECAATEWAESGVRVNTVAPGSIASQGLDTYEDKDTAFIQNDLTPGIPLQRFGTEAEVSAAIVYLLSPAASYITGSCIRIDGGAPNARRGWWDLQPSQEQRRLRRLPPVHATGDPRRGAVTPLQAIIHRLRRRGARRHGRCRARNREPVRRAGCAGGDARARITNAARRRARRSARVASRGEVSFVQVDATDPDDTLAGRAGVSRRARFDRRAGEHDGSQRPPAAAAHHPDPVRPTAHQRDHPAAPAHDARRVAGDARAVDAGSIVNVASDAAKVATPGETLVGAAMAAIVMYSKAAALEAKREGVRINVLTPSLIADTPGAALIGSDPFSAKLFEKAAAMAHLGVASPADLAAMTLFLASPAASRITGQTISINGGISVG